MGFFPFFVVIPPRCRLLHRLSRHLLLLTHSVINSRTHSLTHSLTHSSSRTHTSHTQLTGPHLTLTPLRHPTLFHTANTPTHAHLLLTPLTPITHTLTPLTLITHFTLITLPTLTHYCYFFPAPRSALPAIGHLKKQKDD